MIFKILETVERRLLRFFSVLARGWSSSEELSTMIGGVRTSYPRASSRHEKLRAVVIDCVKCSVSVDVQIAVVLSVADKSPRNAYIVSPEGMLATSRIGANQHGIGTNQNINRPS